MQSIICNKTEDTIFIGVAIVVEKRLIRVIEKVKRKNINYYHGRKYEIIRNNDKKGDLAFYTIYDLDDNLVYHAKYNWLFANKPRHRWTIGRIVPSGDKYGKP